MDQEAKAKLASRLSSALHQAPDHPENFANVLTKQLATHGMHISDLRITFGDIDSFMAKQLQAAKRNAPPTYVNLMDMAEPKLSLKGRTPERALADALGVPPSEVVEWKRAGIVPRIWFDRVHALPGLDETTAELSPEVKRVVEALFDDGFSPDEIHQVFVRMRTTRISAKQIEVMQQQNVTIGVPEIGSMRDELFGRRSDRKKRMDIWLATHLEEPVDSGTAPSLSKDQADRLSDRYRTEIRLRGEDPCYARAAETAELMPRPRRALGHRGRSSSGGAGSVARVLSAVFGDQTDAANRLSQLTGLTPRHALDLVKGSNNLPDDWTEFLNAVAAQLRQNAVTAEERVEPTLTVGDRQIVFELAGSGRVVPIMKSMARRA
jgi:hypothetical protein